MACSRLLRYALSTVPDGQTAVSHAWSDDRSIAINCKSSAQCPAAIAIDSALNALGHLIPPPPWPHWPHWFSLPPKWPSLAGALNAVQ